MFNFITFPSDDDTSWSPRFAVFGDMGFANARSLPSLTSAANSRDFDMVLHLGDISYDLFSMQGRTGDQFMRAIQPIAANIPYTVLPGNLLLDCTCN